MESWPARQGSACRAPLLQKRGTARRSRPSRERTVSLDANNQPFLNKTFTDGDLLLVSNAVLAACDGFDGAPDGIVQSFTSCTTMAVEPKLAEITCTGPKTDVCVSPEQVAALKKVFSGARTSKGDSVTPPGRGTPALAERLVRPTTRAGVSGRLARMERRRNSAINLTLGALALPQIFVTPPVETPVAAGAPASHALRFDFDDAPRALANTSGAFRQSALEFMKADSTDLSKFRQRGGKLVIAHGVSDPVFSILDTVEWWNQVNASNSGASRRVRPDVCGPGHEPLRWRSFHRSVRRIRSPGQLGRERCCAGPNRGDGAHVDAVAGPDAAAVPASEGRALQRMPAASKTPRTSCASEAPRGISNQAGSNGGKALALRSRGLTSLSPRLRRSARASAKAEGLRHLTRHTTL